MRTYSEASQPTSPVRQLKWIQQNKPNIETKPEDLEMYRNYLMSPTSNIHMRGMSRSQIARIKAKLNPKWLTEIMLKRKVAQISDELIENHEYEFKDFNF